MKKILLRDDPVGMALPDLYSPHFYELSEDRLSFHPFHPQ